MAKELASLLAQWKSKAENDLQTIEHLLDDAEILTDPICFHAQQAAEKFLKLFLISRNTMPPKTHNIKELLVECAKFDPDFQNLNDAVILTEYAVSLRYPDDFYTPSIEEAKDAHHLAKKVQDFVMPRLPFPSSNI
jgi:HEPN domain-containing protein